MPFLSNHVLVVESSILNLTEASEACTSLDVGLGSFVMSGMRHRSTLEVFLCFSLLWMMALILVFWSTVN